MGRALGAVLLVLLALLGDGSMARAADPQAGQAIFARCRICHAVESGKLSPLGPNLHGLFGRKAGSVEGYKYSEAMQNSGIVWDDASLAHFLRDPKTALPGNRMAFPGIKDEAELADLIEYLHQATH